jgi:trehalose 6-phosphate synthase/phosphatase
MADEEVSRPIEGLQRQQSVHPALLPHVTEVPVTPGIHLGSYADGHHSVGQSYFGHDGNSHYSEWAQSPSEAAAGAKSDQDILRRMSLTSSHKRQDSLSDTDPRSAFPTLSLSGSVISATFCIPHSLEYRKGRDWVSLLSIQTHIF